MKKQFFNNKLIGLNQVTSATKYGFFIESVYNTIVWLHYSTALQIYSKLIVNLICYVDSHCW